MMVTGTIGTDAVGHDRHPEGAITLSPIELAYFLGDELRRIALRITGSHAAAHDVTQEVFVRVLTRGGYDPSKGTLEVWLHTVAHNTAIDWVRREAAHQRRLVHTGGIHSATMPVVEDTVTERIQADHVRAAVARLQVRN